MKNSSKVNVHILNRLYFLEFWNHSKIEQKVQSSYMCPPPNRSLPTLSTPHQCGMFVTIDDSAVTHPHHPNSIVYISFHHWWCTFYGF